MRKILLILFIALTCSCAKRVDPVKSSGVVSPFEFFGESKSLAGFQEYYEAPADGEIIISVTGPMGEPFTYSKLNILGGTRTKGLNSGPFTVNTNISVPNEGGDFTYKGEPTGIFGDSITLGLGNYYKTKSIYSPKRLFVETDTTPLAIGKEYTWNTDTANPHGMAVMLDFDHDFLNDSSFDDEPEVHRMIVTDDDGSYTFGEEMLAGIPNGAVVWVAFVRGNYTRIKSIDGKYDYKILCYSKEFGIFTLRKN